MASAAADDSSGSTAVVAVVMDNTLHVANAGDSRAVISRSGVGSSPLTTDHKPEDEGEYNRIVTRGGVYDEDFEASNATGDQYLSARARSVIVRTSRVNPRRTSSRPS